MDKLSPSPVYVRVLGGLALIGAEGRDLAPSGKKLRALVALLALPPSLGWSREQLTAMLWGDRDEDLARGSLRQALAELRRLLGDEVLAADRETVAFDSTFVSSDAAEFAALSAAGQWDKAAALYRGDLLTGISLPNGVFADWLLVERTRLHDLAVRALREVLQRQSSDEAITTALRLQELEPDREETYRVLMRLYAAKGDRSQALRQYQLCRDHLQRELGVKPELETERLLEQVRLPGSRTAQPAPLQTESKSADQALPPTPLPARATRPRWRWWAVAGLALTLVVGATVATWHLSGKPPIDPDGEPPTLAVLPFENLSDDPQQAFFADGIADDLMTDLSRLNGLVVVGRNSTFAYRDQPVDLGKVARELDVRYVIEGSVRRAGDQVRINVMLVDATTGSQQWAQRYDGSLSDIFALQDKVAGAVANALSLRLTAGEQRELARHETASLEAYDAFLRGWKRYRTASPEDLVKAIPHFEQAIELDPGYGRAHAALAMIYFQAYDQGWAGRLDLSSEDAYRQARNHLKIAQLHPTSTSHQVAGNMSRALGWHKDALKDFKAAMALDPNDSWSYIYAAQTLLAAGDLPAAEEQIRVAMRLEPYPPPLFLFHQGLLALAQNRLADAAAKFEAGIRLEPQDPWPWLHLVATYGYSGRSKEATAALAAFNLIRIQQGGIPLTLDCYYMRGSSFYPGPTRGGLGRGLELAGVPRWFEVRQFDRDRLSPKEMDALLFGHRIHGRSLESGEEHGASVAADGSAMMFGDWGNGNGDARLRDDLLCFEWKSGHINCGAVYRNPGGTRTTENEFIWFSHEAGGFPFSVVD